jgi:hypothetical protein
MPLMKAGRMTINGLYKQIVWWTDNPELHLQWMFLRWLQKILFLYYPMSNVTHIRFRNELETWKSIFETWKTIQLSVMSFSGTSVIK